VLHVARAGFYEWQRESVCDRAKEDARLLNLIRGSYVASSGVYGARRVFGDLREAGESCGRPVVQPRRGPTERQGPLTPCAYDNPDKKIALSSL
jgi:hypothetical protein